MHAIANVTTQIPAMAYAIALSQIDAAEPQGLTTAGAAIMIGSITMVVAFLTFCMYRILSESNPKTHHHAPLEIDTKDND